MSRFPNHGLFARTAAASTRSSSLIAQARRGAPRRRSAAISPSAGLQLASNSGAASRTSNQMSPHCSLPQPAFIGPLTLAASQHASAQITPAPAPAADSRLDPTSSASGNQLPYSLEMRRLRYVQNDHLLTIGRAPDSHPFNYAAALEPDLVIAAALNLADLSLQTSSQAGIFPSISIPSSATSATSRHMARAHGSPFPSTPTDRSLTYRAVPTHPLTHTRAVHIFFPNAGAAHALNHGSSSAYDTQCNVSSPEIPALALQRTSPKSPSHVRQATDYVPLWNASTAADASSYATLNSAPGSFTPYLDGIDVLASSISDTDRFKTSSCHVPLTLLTSSSHPRSPRQHHRVGFAQHETTAGSAHSADAFPRPRRTFPSSNHPPPFGSAAGDYTSTASWDETDTSSSSWRPSASSSSQSSKSSSSSSSSSSSRSPSPTISARPHLATSSAKQDSSGSHGSGSSTPTRTTSLAQQQIEHGLLGPSSLLTTAALNAQCSFDQRRGTAAAATPESSEVSAPSQVWTGSFASPKHRKLHYAFEHGAYGIPKRHPWAAVRGNGKRVQSTPKAATRSGAVGMLAAAADFLTGSASPSGPAAPKEKLGGEAMVAEDGRRLGLNSPIREHGRIVQDRLQSVQVGEDAYFLRPDSIGVADGVGGWASRAGADPALFSRLLMHFCAAELSKFDALDTDQLTANGAKMLREWEQLDPVEVMHIAWERCVRASRREGILGSSTALVAVLRGDELRIANLGDCVLLIIRAGELLFRSTEQQHSFNFPVQLGMMGHTAESVTIAANRTLSRDGFLQSGASDDLDDSAPNPLGTTTAASMDEARKGYQNATTTSEGEETEEVEWDEPRRDAGRWTVKVQKGDIIIVGSDGLVDNLFDEDIVEEVLKFAPPSGSRTSIPEDADVPLDDGGRAIVGEEEYRLPQDFDPQLVSEALCSRAKAVSEDSRAVSSPFQQRAMEEGLHYVGGKHDDISVVVAVVGDPSERLAHAGFSSGSDNAAITESSQQNREKPSARHDARSSRLQLDIASNLHT